MPTGRRQKTRPFKMDSSPVKRCNHKKEVLVFHDHGIGKWLFLKGNYYWREPFFTSMMMGERVINSVPNRVLKGWAVNS